MPTAQITALGTYTPPNLLTNADLERMVETTSQWILERTGIHTRHIAPPEMATSDMAVEAAKALLVRRGIDPTEIEAIIVCTVTPDMFFPATACLVQHRIGAKGAWGFDLVAACSGFVFGLTTAAHLVMAGTHKKVLVIGADTMSRIINYKDRSTCVLFGDGAGAMLVEAAPDGAPGFIGFHNEIDGSGGEHLKMPAGGSRLPSSHDTIDKQLHYVHQEGSQVFKYAVRKMEESCRAVLDKHDIDGKDIVLIPHQANLRISEGVQKALKLPDDRVYNNIQRYGNTTAATIPIAYDECKKSGKLKPGDLVAFVGLGAGFHWGAALMRE